MFVRAELKNQAKQIMRTRYFLMVLVCLIASFVAGSMIELNFDLEAQTAVLYLFGRFSFSVNYHRALMMAVPVGIVGLLWVFFVVNPAWVGIYSFFKHCSCAEEKIEDIWSGFKDNYAHNIKVMFMMRLKVFFWTLLFIIPGIMKSYSYYFVPYLLSDYPELDTEEILAMSEKMANGIRFEIFVLNMSFFWWELLAVLCAVFTFGLSGVLLQPYIYQTEAQLYHWAKEYRLFEHFESEDNSDDQSNLL